MVLARQTNNWCRFLCRLGSFCVESCYRRICARKRLLQCRCFGRGIHDHFLDLGPGFGSWARHICVVWLCEGNDLIAMCPQRLDVVGRIVDVEVGFHFGFGTEETDVAIRQSLPIEPLGRVGDSDCVPPVHIQPVGDDPNPDARVAQPPQGFGCAGYDGHVAKHSALQYRDAMQSLEISFAEAPLVEPPRTLKGEVFGIHPQFLGHDRTKRKGVVGADAVEVDSEYERCGWHPREGTAPGGEPGSSVGQRSEPEGSGVGLALLGEVERGLGQYGVGSEQPQRGSGQQPRVTVVVI